MKFLSIQNKLYNGHCINCTYHIKYTMYINHIIVKSFLLIDKAWKFQFDFPGPHKPVTLKIYWSIT